MQKKAWNSQPWRRQATIYPLFQLNQFYQTSVQCCARRCLFSNSLIWHISEHSLNCLYSLPVFSTPDQPYFYWLWCWTEVHLLWTWRTRHKVLGWLVWGPCDRELCDCGSLNVRHDGLELKESASWLTGLRGFKMTSFAHFAYTASKHCCC